MEPMFVLTPTRMRCGPLKLYLSRPSPCQTLYRAVWLACSTNLLVRRSTLSSQLVVQLAEQSHPERPLPTNLTARLTHCILDRALAFADEWPYCRVQASVR